MPTREVFHNVVLCFGLQWMHCIWGYPGDQRINSNHVLNILDTNIVDHPTA